MEFSLTPTNKWIFQNRPKSLNQRSHKEGKNTNHKLKGKEKEKKN